jgi:putative acyl-CoA dehydrogenase
MVQLTRLDCAISSAGMMRAALARALHHCRHRSVFQKRLADQPMMRAVLADMALEAEAAAALVMRLCRSFDLAATNANEAARARLLTPAVKYWVCKRAPAFVYEAMECLGGNGYVEDYVLARLYREAPVNAIWEGSGNVMCLDVLRAMSRDADGGQMVLAGLVREAENLSGVARAGEDLTKIVAGPSAETAARGAVERLALIAAAAALQTSVPRPIAGAFIRTKLAGRSGTFHGANELSAAEIGMLLERALPIS